MRLTRWWCFIILFLIIPVCMRERERECVWESSHFISFCIIFIFCASTFVCCFVSPSMDKALCWDISGIPHQAFFSRSARQMLTQLVRMLCTSGLHWCPFEHIASFCLRSNCVSNFMVLCWQTNVAFVLTVLNKSVELFSGTLIAHGSMEFCATMLVLNNGNQELLARNCFVCAFPQAPLEDNVHMCILKDSHTTLNQVLFNLMTLPTRKSNNVASMSNATLFMVASKQSQSVPSSLSRNLSQWFCPKLCGPTFTVASLLRTLH